MKELKYLGDLLKSKVEELSDKCQTTKDAILSKVYDIVHNYFKNNPPIDLRKNSTSANPSNIACLGAPASGKSSLNTDQDIKNKIQLCTDLYRTVFPEELAEKLKNKQSYQHTQDYAYVMKEFLVYAIKQQQSDQHAAIVYAGLSLSKDIQQVLPKDNTTCKVACLGNPVEAHKRAGARAAKGPEQGRRVNT